jgi:SAM-dependent methyltransferase
VRLVTLPGVFRPISDSWLLADALDAEPLPPGARVLDLCTGTGDLAIAVVTHVAGASVVGVDFAGQMLRLGRAKLRTLGLTSSIRLVRGDGMRIPLGDGSCDAVTIGFGIRNMAGLEAALAEIARVLKPGGRVAVSDLALVRPLPDAIAADLEALVGCVAGAVLVEETRAMMQAAGLTDVTLTLKPEYVDAMTRWEDPLYRRIVEQLPPGSRTSDYVTSLDVSARKQ